MKKRLMFIITAILIPFIILAVNAVWYIIDDANSKDPSSNYIPVSVDDTQTTTYNAYLQSIEVKGLGSDDCITYYYETEVINGVKATAEKGVKDAATAQSTADGAASAALGAQTDATKALADAAKAQQAADDAQADATANAAEIVKVSARAEKGISDASTAKAAADAAQEAADAA